MAHRALDLYLNDHLAGATFGVDLARHLESHARDPEQATRFRDLADQIETDRQTLCRVMDRLGTTRNPVKQATTWTAEKLSRARLIGLRILAGELGLFTALEMLSLGVEGKASLWRELRDLSDRYPELDAVELDGLIARAEDQRRALEAERVAAGRRAFSV